MPTAMPTCRNVSLIPEAMPLCSLGTTDTATSAITGLTRPTPGPARRKPGSRVVHSSPRPDAAHQQQRAPRSSTSPPDSSKRAWNVVISSARVAAETKKVVTVSGR